MNIKVGQNYYLKGTKQRFHIIDRDFGGNYYLISFPNLRRAYLDYLQIKITEHEIEEKYQLIYYE